MLATTTVTWKILNANLDGGEIDIPIFFYVTVANANMGSLKYHL